MWCLQKIPDKTANTHLFQIRTKKKVLNVTTAHFDMTEKISGTFNLMALMFYKKKKPLA